jgi:hypothetical protein
VCQNKVDRRRQISHGDIRSSDRSILVGGLGELRRACGATVSAQVHEVYVVTLSGDVVHPGFAIDLQVKRTGRGLRRAMDVQQRSLASELGHSDRMLVPDK